MLRKEIFNPVGIDKTTIFIKRNCQWTVTRPNLQNVISAFVLFCNKLKHSLPISSSLTARVRGNIFNLKNSATFIRNHTFTLYPVIFQDIHSTPIKIKVDHTFLFIRQQQKGNILLFVFCNLSYLHFSLTNHVP